MSGLSHFAASFADTYLVSPRTTTFHLLFVAAFLIFAIGIFIRPWRSTVIVGFLTFLLGLYAFELFLVLTQPSASKARLMSEAANNAAAARGAPTDRRLLREVVRDLRAAGQDAYPTVSPTSYLLDGRTPQPMPLTNIKLAKSVYCNESGTWLVFDSDRYGFNNPDRWWDQAANAAIVGDSFAQGACVQPEQSVASVLRQQGITALSLGVAGTGPLIQLGVLKEYGALKRPAQVYWLFYEGNDIHVNLELERRSQWLRQYLQPGFTADLATRQAQTDATMRREVDALLARPDEPDRALPWSARLRRMAALLDTRDKLGLTACPRRTQDFDLLHDIFAEARRAVESWGGKLTVIYLPSQHQCDLFGIVDRRTNWFYDGAMSAIERAGVPVIDLKQRFHELGSPDKFHYYPGSHFSEAGYRFVADAISKSAGH